MYATPSMPGTSGTVLITRSSEGRPHARVLRRDERTAGSCHPRRWSDNRSACLAVLEARTQRSAATKDALLPAGRHDPTASLNQPRWPSRASRLGHTAACDETGPTSCVSPLLEAVGLV